MIGVQPVDGRTHEAGTVHITADCYRRAERSGGRCEDRRGCPQARYFRATPLQPEGHVWRVGVTLNTAVASLTHWAEQDMDTILVAQQEYDKRTVALQR